jgi:hypothetical protein
MRKPRLDRSRDYGEVHPAGTLGIHFRQDGLPFDHEGKLVLDQLTKEQTARLNGPEEAKPVKGKASSSPFSLEQLRALEALDLLSDEQKSALAALAAKDPHAPKKPPKPGSNDDGDENGVNLEAWLRGEVDYLFSRVTTAVFTRYKKKCTRKDDLVQFLVLDGDGPHLVPQADVSDKHKGALGGDKD